MPLLTGQLGSSHLESLKGRQSDRSGPGLEVSKGLARLDIPDGSLTQLRVDSDCQLEVSCGCRPGHLHGDSPRGCSRTVARSQEEVSQEANILRHPDRSCKGASDPAYVPPRVTPTASSGSGIKEGQPGFKRRGLYSTA